MTERRLVNFEIFDQSDDLTTIGIITHQGHSYPMKGHDLTNKKTMTMTMTMTMTFGEHPQRATLETFDL